MGADSKLDALGPVEAPEAAAGTDQTGMRARFSRVLFGESFLSGVLRSFLTLAAGEWVARLIGVAIQIWLARKLTPGPYGVITFGIALIGWFGLVVDSGTEQLNVRDISRRPERFRELADTVLGLRIALSIVAGIVARLRDLPLLQLGGRAHRAAALRARAPGARNQPALDGARDRQGESGRARERRLADRLPGRDRPARLQPFGRQDRPHSRGAERGHLRRGDHRARGQGVRPRAASDRPRRLARRR